jgi:hypothetical protein
MGIVSKQGKQQSLAGRFVAAAAVVTIAIAVSSVLSGCRSEATAQAEVALPEVSVAAAVER